ncbi:hypothetical protein, partial [Lamprobacter sp.]|uniref:hypothetical protein n=1 Tax=Lamprobacter sp. TaxID=3100796 RepID=UPI002B25E4F4
DEALSVLWAYKARLANRLLFLIAGISVQLVMFTDQWLVMLIGIGATMVARAAAVLLLLPLAVRLPGTERLPGAWYPLLWWGGTRGRGDPGAGVVAAGGAAVLVDDPVHRLWRGALDPVGADHEHAAGAALAASLNRYRVARIIAQAPLVVRAARSHLAEHPGLLAHMTGLSSATVHAIDPLQGIGIATVIRLALAKRIVGIVVRIVQQQSRLEACLEGQRALERTCTRGALRSMGLKFGLSSLRIDQQLPAKGETVHGLSPLREADSALISARTRLVQRIFRHDDARVSTALQ